MTTPPPTAGSTRGGRVAERLALHGLDYPVPAKANRLDFMLGALTLVSLTLLAVEISSWIANTSSIVLVYFSAHRWESVSASISWAVTRRLCPARRTLPSSA